MSENPFRPDFDARTGFYPRRGTPRGIYGVVKVTYDFVDAARPVDAIPLTSDILRPDVEAKLELGCDFWLDKQYTDIVVLGSAYSRDPVSEMQISVTVGETERRMTVYGRRVARRAGGRIQFTQPEPFTEMPATWARAYGGVDPRVTAKTAPDHDALAELHDHPGLYPRNPYGKGYVVLELASDQQVELPNLEDPADLLTPARLIVGEPSRWWMQPIPAALGYSPHAVFTRYAYLGADAWFSPPDDSSLPEVRKGILPPGFRTSYDPRLACGFYQEAAPGLALPLPESGSRIVVRGMHPGGLVMRTRLPPPPALEIELEGRRQVPALHLSKVVLIPAKQRFVLTWVARTSEMHRIFLPGVHARIPLRMRIGAKDWVDYQPPKTLRQAVDEAKRAGTDLSAPRPRRPRSRSNQP